MIRIENRVQIGALERIVSAEVPEDADDWQVAIVAGQIEDISKKLARLSSCCLVPVGAVHRSSCVHARDYDDWYETLRQSAIKEGMAP